MKQFKAMPPAGAVVILVILALFVLAVVMLLRVVSRYRRLSRMVAEGDVDGDAFLIYTRKRFAAAYKDYGKETNTPAIITEAMGTKLSRLLFRERFLNNAVSLFVTLGLFGTFLGLSLAVVSLTELIGYSNTTEWLSVLDSVGGGLMSALSGMGVAFYTSLVGAGCSILLTILRSVFNPQTEREKLSTQLELWLDHSVAPGLPTKTAKDDAELVHQMIDGMDRAAKAMDTALKQSSEDFQKTLENSKPYLVAFHQTVDRFSAGVHDFTEVDYDLRGTVERMDLAIRDLLKVLPQRSRNGQEKGAGQ